MVSVASQRRWLLQNEQSNARKIELITSVRWLPLTCVYVFIVLKVFVRLRCICQTGHALVSGRDLVTAQLGYKIRQIPKNSFEFEGSHNSALCVHCCATMLMRYEPPCPS